MMSGTLQGVLPGLMGDASRPEALILWDWKELSVGRDASTSPKRVTHSVFSASQLDGKVLLGFTVACT